VLGYLTFKLFSPDGRYLFFASDRTGTFQLYRLDLEREEAVQVTGPGGMDAAQGVPTAGQWRDSNVHRQRNEFACCTDRRLVMADVQTLEHRVLAECPPQWSKLDATPQFSGDGRMFATIYQQPDGRRGIAIGEVGDKPSRLTSVLLAPPGHHVGYLISSPTPQFILSVCMGEGDKQNDPALPPELRARAWRVDPATGEARPYIVTPPGFRATHQYWGPEGRCYYHRKTVGTWTPTWVDSIDIDGGDCRTHYGSPDRKLGHSCISPDGSRLVVDVQEPDHNELILADARTGAGRIICWPNSTVAGNNSQASHVHPSVDFQGRQVAFQSDAAGRCSLFLAEMPRP
jgi:dipeptidyl aminopeptidase/acylaminoacyl peptidase